LTKNYPENILCNQKKVVPLSGRVTANNIANLLIDYTKSKTNDRTTDKRKELTHTVGFLKDWQKRNIELDTTYADRKKNSEGELDGISKLLNRKIFGKWLSVKIKNSKNF